MDITHKREPDIFCDCKDCEAFFVARAEAMRVWQNATASDETEQAQEFEDAYQERETSAYERHTESLLY